MNNSERNRLAGDILRYSRQTLLKQWPYLGPLLYQLQMCPMEEVHIMGSNGQFLYYNPEDVIALYKEDSSEIPKMMIHVLGHCMLQHVERRNGREHALYDTACDLSVFQLIEKLPGGRSFVGTAEERSRVNSLLGLRGHVSAESLYQDGKKDAQLMQNMENLSQTVYRDDHRIWGKKLEAQEGEDGSSSSFLWKQAMQRAADEYQQMMQREGRYQGMGSGDWTSMLDLDQEESNISYEELLRRFTVPVEVMRIDMDSMDLSWYVTGLNLYGDMPIVEYNEYRDMDLVETFIIAIDTSGSCCGSTLDEFLNQTKKAVEDMELQGRPFRLRMIQCDSGIQKEVEVRTKEQFDDYVSHFRVYGGGGTDFRPVFQRVNQLVTEEEGYEKLKGFLYFSDGFGDFPKQPTSYETVFVIPKEDLSFKPPIPDWVTVACLKERQLNMIEA